MHHRSAADIRRLSYDELAGLNAIIVYPLCMHGQYSSHREIAPCVVKLRSRFAPDAMNGSITRQLRTHPHPFLSSCPLLVNCARRTATFDSQVQGFLSTSGDRFTLHYAILDRARTPVVWQTMGRCATRAVFMVAT
jgi:hypothetical protein